MCDRPPGLSPAGARGAGAAGGLLVTIASLAAIEIRGRDLGEIEVERWTGGCAGCGENYKERQFGRAHSVPILGRRNGVFKFILLLDYVSQSTTHALCPICRYYIAFQLLNAEATSLGRVSGVSRSARSFALYNLRRAIYYAGIATPAPDILADKYNMRVPRRYLFRMALMAAPVYSATSLPFDSGWRFLKGYPAAAERPRFDDGSWRTVNVPHDCAIEGPFDEKNPAGGAGASLPGRVGWYRRSFMLTTADAKRRVFQENVEVYRNCPDVELLLNGKSRGSKPLLAGASPRNWQGGFEPGTVEASCRNGPREELRTAGKAAKIASSVGQFKLTPDWDGVAYVTATVRDGQGVAVPAADNEVAFQVSGPGAVAAVDDVDNASHEPFQASSRRPYRGACIAVIRATASGLAASSATIEAVSK